MIRLHLLLLLFLLANCGGGQRPLDADTRQRIDSLSYVRTNQLRVQLDSACSAQRPQALVQVVDSIRRVREQEIAEQLRTISK